MIRLSARGPTWDSARVCCGPDFRSQTRVVVLRVLVVHSDQRKNVVGGAMRTSFSPLFVLAVLIPGIVFHASCSNPAERVCVPGLTNACLGPGACVGSQVCTVSGAGYGPCDCGAEQHDGGQDGGERNDAGKGDAGLTCAVFEGSLIISNQQDWTDFIDLGCTRVSGDLIISVPGLSSLSPPASALQAVGSLTVSDNPALTDFSLPALTGR